MVTPILEKPDEGGHYGYLLYLREHASLPPLAHVDIWSFEFKQPPLYYAIAAALTSWLPVSPDMRQSLTRNPYVWESVPGYRNDNRNRYLHPPTMTPLALAARLISSIFGLGSMITSYFLARQVFRTNGKIPIATAALVGFQPQFIYMATAINNDAAIAFWGTLTVTLLIYRLKSDKLPHFATLIGVLLGLASITKVSGLVFFPLVGLGLFFIHRGFRRAFFRDGIMIIVIALLVGGWWYARNMLVYHDPLALNVHYAGAESPDDNLPWNQLKYSIASMEYTFWANQARVFISPITLDSVLIGWGRIGLGLLALSCVFNYQSIRNNLPIWIVLSSWPIAFLGLLLGYWRQKFPASFGRLLFPAIAPIALLFVAGWNFAFPPRWRSSILTISVGTMIVASSLIPFVSLHPLYNPSREWQASQVEHSVEITYVEPETKKQIARLIGYNLSRPYIAPGEYIPLELCWEPLGHTHLPYVMFVQLLDLHQTDADSSPDVWGRRMTYPGLGSRPTDRWALQQAFCDTVLIQAFPDTPTPLGVAIEVGFFNPENESRLEIVDKENDPIALAHIGGISIISPQALSATRRAAPYIFDNAIGLEPIQFSGTPGRSITLTLTWQSLQSVSYDATVFIHLKGADGSTLAQVDREPLDGRFPTSYWFPGQIITDVISLPLARDLPNETLAVHVGMYTWPSLQRLPVIDAVGNPQRDNVIVTDWTSQRKTP